MPLNMTPTREAVLRAVGRGEVVHYRGLGRGEGNRDEWRGAAIPKGAVTRACNDLSAATPRLIRPGQYLGKSMYSGQRWALTPAGEKALADLDAKETAR